MTEKVLQCIEIARRAKLDILISRQQQLKINSKDLRWKWEPCMQGKIFQVLLSPIVYPSLIIFIFFDYHFSKAKIKRQIQSLEKGTLPFPQDNKFNNLWKTQGLDKTYSDLERLRILEQWIAILYPDRLNDFGAIKDELIARLQNSTGTAHISLVDEVSFIIKSLDLPDYGA